MNLISLESRYPYSRDLPLSKEDVLAMNSRELQKQDPKQILAAYESGTVLERVAMACCLMKCCPGSRAWQEVRFLAMDDETVSDALTLVRFLEFAPSTPDDLLSQDCQPLVDALLLACLECLNRHEGTDLLFPPSCTNLLSQRGPFMAAAKTAALCGLYVLCRARVPKDLDQKALIDEAITQLPLPDSLKQSFLEENISCLNLDQSYVSRTLSSLLSRTGTPVSETSWLPALSGQSVVSRTPHLGQDTIQAPADKLKFWP